MPRKARKLAESGIYHVMLRGIDRQRIFEDQEDCEYFLNILRECRVCSNFQLYAFCLMGNHVHLLLKIQDEGLETVFKRIGGRYVYYYNAKYQRVGPLFQGRFKSEPVEEDTYFITVLRYIHQNPVKAGLCKKVEDYAYSSFCEYMSKSEWVDFEFAFSLIDYADFLRFNNAPNSDSCLEMNTSMCHAVTDMQAQDIIAKISHCKTVVEFQELSEKKKERYVKKIHEKGVSVRQINRLTGTTKGMVEKFLKA